MTVRELIAMLGNLPQDLQVVHSTGTMQDCEEVTGYTMSEPGDTAWTSDIRHMEHPWVELL